jgi:LysR family transcriptional regulator, hydrogen peroxide-inducible genes activator
VHDRTRQPDRPRLDHPGELVLQQRLLDGELEVAIYCLPGGADERLHALPLFREPFVIALNAQHRLARQNAVKASDLDGERYLNRVNCEVLDQARAIFLEHGSKVNRIYRSERDDWILAMVAAGLGFGFLPQYCVPERGDVVVRPLVEPEIWREVNLFTVRGRPHSPAVGALVREAMRFKWMGAEPLGTARETGDETPQRARVLGVVACADPSP